MYYPTPLTPLYKLLRFILSYGIIFLLVCQLSNCSCEPNKKRPLTRLSQIKQGGLIMEISPTELIGDQGNIAVKFSPTNKEIVFLDRYKLTVIIEDRAGVIKSKSKIYDYETNYRIKIKGQTLSSFSIFKELNPSDTNYNQVIMNLLLKPSIGSRQVVVKFELHDIHGKLIQKASTTWRIEFDEPIPDPEEPIDPHAVIIEKNSPSERDKEIAEEILRKQREKEAKKAEEYRIEEEIRKKRGEEWFREAREKRQREQEEQERESARQKEEIRQFRERSHREAKEAWNRM